MSDAELLRRYGVLYPRPTPYQVARLEVIQAQLPANGPEAEAWRRRQLALMNDVSQYMKLVKGTSATGPSLGGWTIKQVTGAQSAKECRSMRRN